MKRTIQSSFLLIAVIVFGSCASIVSKTNWPLHVSSDPAQANITITDRSGRLVYKGSTPAQMKLKSGHGFFKKESYTVHFELEGYASQDIPLECKINGWYFGNILLGGVLGMLIIDPATGAMYKLETPILDARLAKNATTGIETDPSLKISNINDLPQSMVKSLVRIK